MTSRRKISTNNNNNHNHRPNSILPKNISRKLLHHPKTTDWRSSPSLPTTEYDNRTIQIDKLNRTIDGLRAEMAIQELQQEREIQTLQQTLQTTRNDAEERISNSQLEHDEIIQSLQSELRTKDETISALQYQISNLQKEHQTTLNELSETKTKLSETIDDYEQRLVDTKVEVLETLQLCHNDCQTATQSVQNTQQHQSTTLAETESLRRQLNAVQNVVTSLESQSEMEGSECHTTQHEINNMKMELVKTKREYETMLNSYECELKELKLAVSVAEGRRKAAEEDALVARDQLTEVQWMLDALRNERREEVMPKEKIGIGFWWKRVVSFFHKDGYEQSGLGKNEFNLN